MYCASCWLTDWLESVTGDWTGVLTGECHVRGKNAVRQWQWQQSELTTTKTMTKKATTNSCHGRVFSPQFVTNNHKIYLLKYAPHRSSKIDRRKPRQLSVRIDGDFFFIVKHQLNATGAEKELAASCVLGESCEWMWIRVKMTHSHGLCQFHCSPFEWYANEAKNRDNICVLASHFAGLKLELTRLNSSTRSKTTPFKCFSFFFFVRLSTRLRTNDHFGESLRTRTLNQTVILPLKLPNANMYETKRVFARQTKQTSER